MKFKVQNITLSSIQTASGPTDTATVSLNYGSPNELPFGSMNLVMSIDDAQKLKLGQEITVTI